MKIKPSDGGRVLQDIAKWRVLFLHGSDVGLISERASEAITRVSGTYDDPFSVTQLEPEEWERLEEEARSFSLLGGRRVVRLRGAQDHIIEPLERLLAQESDAFLVLEAGNGKIKKLQAFAEKHKNIASIGCYSEERTVTQTIMQTLKAEKIEIDHDALGWLRSHLASDQLVVKRELEKICLYALPQARLSLDDVRQAIGDSGGSSLEDAIYAALSGDVALADLAFERAIADGIHAIQFTRLTLSILEKLQIAAWSVEEGHSLKEATDLLRPPLFFKRKENFMTALRRFPPHIIRNFLYDTQELEKLCKSSLAAAGTNFDLLLCRRHLTRLCYKYTG